MKNLLYASIALFLLLVAFLAGSWFNQAAANRDVVGAGERRILHYVDPMNLSNISSEPGIAPCGMPMEPVYADEELNASGMVGSAATGVPGAVRVNLGKQQLIGVQVVEVRRSAETHAIRSLGRVVPDENRTYALYAATDGWMGEVHESTTGSLVRKDQLMAQIRVYDYDFFTWQQRYLTELGNAGMRPVYITPPSRSSQMNTMSAGRTMPSSPKAGAQVLYKDPSSMEVPGSGAKSEKVKGIPPGADQYGNGEGALPQDPATIDRASGNGSAPGEPGHDTEKMTESNRQVTPDPMANPAAQAHHMAANDDRLGFVREDDILYATKGRLELLDLGVGETQLSELAKKGSYVTRIDLRSPVDGIVLSRNVSPRQRIDRGAECFRIADISKVWIEADLYEPERAYIESGMSALVSLPGQDRYYKARVSEVPPRFDAVTRTLKVRLEMDNPEYLLRPDMFVDVQVMIDLPEAITVPAGAVIDSGLRKTVYVAAGEGVYEPRAVQTGWRFADRVEIVDGLQAGEKIAVSGNFLIDSESRMKLAAAGLATVAAPPVTKRPEKGSSSVHGPQTALHAGNRQNDEVKAIDPVCAMKVDKEQAELAGLTVDHNGTVYYFCSEDCREQFTRSPVSFTEKSGGSPPREDVSGQHARHKHD